VIQNLFQSKRTTFVLVVIAYLLIHAINNALTDFLYLQPGAHFVHVPSGFKLLFVLIAGFVGALGIATAALLAAVLYQFPGEYLLGVQLALVNGMAPLVARKLAIDHFGMNDDLSHVTVKQLAAVGLVCVLMNSTLNQSVLYWNGVHFNFLEGSFVMLVGDLTGVYIVFLLLKLLSKKLVRTEKPERK
jgi:hypothetical protein